MQQGHPRRLRPNLQPAGARLARLHYRLITEQVIGAVLRRDLLERAIEVVVQDRSAARRARKVPKRADVERLEVTALVSTGRLQPARVDRVDGDVGGARRFDQPRKHLVITADRPAQIDRFEEPGGRSPPRLNQRIALRRARMCRSCSTTSSRTRKLLRPFLPVPKLSMVVSPSTTAGCLRPAR